MVGALTVTDFEAPAVISPKLQVRSLPTIEQSVLSGSSTHAPAVPEGRVSVTVTALAVPGPALDA